MTRHAMRQLTVRVGMYITQQQQGELRMLAQRYHVPVSQLVRWAIDAYIAREKDGRGPWHDGASRPV